MQHISSSVHTSVHFNDALLLKRNALHSQVHCTFPWSILIGLHTLRALPLKCLMSTLQHKLHPHLVDTSHSCSVHCTLPMHCTCAALRSGITQAYFKKGCIPIQVFPVSKCMRTINFVVCSCIICKTSENACVGDLAANYVYLQLLHMHSGSF